MKICRILFGTTQRYAVQKDEGLGLFPDSWHPGEPLPELSDLENISIDDRTAFLAPVSPSKIVCVGRNYAAHAKELNNPLPTEPLLFLKAPTAVIADGDPIILPAQSEQVEHEGELGVVIGRRCKSIPGDNDPLDYVLGYVCLNDVTARDIQRFDVQFTRGKSFDTFCPVSRYVATEVDPSDLPVEVRVNDEIRQKGRTKDMVFDIPFLIRYISDHMTLLPGDLIATGTPSGVSKLEPGDVCEVRIEGIGRLSNPVTGSGVDH